MFPINLCYFIYYSGFLLEFIVVLRCFLNSYCLADIRALFFKHWWRLNACVIFQLRIFLLVYFIFQYIYSWVLMFLLKIVYDLFISELSEYKTVCSPAEAHKIHPRKGSFVLTRWSRLQSTSFAWFGEVFHECFTVYTRV